MTTDEDHEARAKNWVLKMVGGPQLIGPAGIPPHVYWLLATVLDPEAATFMDYVVEIGSTLETATGSVVVIGDGQIVRIVLTDSPVRETDALATLEILPTSAIESIEVRG